MVLTMLVGQEGKDQVANGAKSFAVVLMIVQEPFLHHPQMALIGCHTREPVTMFFENAQHMK